MRGAGGALQGCRATLSTGVRWGGPDRPPAPSGRDAVAAQRRGSASGAVWASRCCATTKIPATSSSTTLTPLRRRGTMLKAMHRSAFREWAGVADSGSRRLKGRRWCAAREGVALLARRMKIVHKELINKRFLKAVLLPPYEFTPANPLSPLPTAQAPRRRDSHGLPHSFHATRDATPAVSQPGHGRTGAGFPAASLRCRRPDRP